MEHKISQEAAQKMWDEVVAKRNELGGGEQAYRDPNFTKLNDFTFDTLAADGWDVVNDKVVEPTEPPVSE